MPKFHRSLVSAAAVVISGAGFSSAAMADTMDHLTQSQNFAAIQSTVKQQYAPSGPNAGKPQYYQNQARATSTVKYDAASKSYIVRDTGNVSATSSFGPGNKVGAESNATYTVYRKAAGGSTETFTMLNAGAGNPAIQLTYATFAHWRKVTPGGGMSGATAQSDTYFVFGFKTEKASMPVTGSATYTTLLDGTFSDPNKSYNIDGTGSLTANFGTGGLIFGATMTGTPASGPALVFGPINGTGTIKAGSSSFSANGANADYRMDMSGYFFGPAADEIGATFSLSGKGGYGNGAMVGD
jgi:hypothetical protein